MRPARPFHFFFLFFPYGASFGFVLVALPFLAHERGVPVATIGAVVAKAFLPHGFKFLWAPIVDTTWTRKGWYFAALTLVALGTFASMAMPITPSSIGALSSVVVASQMGLTLMGMACEGLLGRSIPLERKSVAAGFFQAGSYLGMGIGGAAAIELVTRFGGAIGGAVLGLAFFACAVPVFFFDEPARDERAPFLDQAKGFVREILAFARSPRGIAVLVICISPVGSGSAGNLFTAIADDWHASRELVVLSNGVLCSLVSAGGAALAGVVTRRMDRRFAYALGGVLTTASGVLMAVFPRVPWAYLVFTLAYQAMNGLAYAAFSALAFESAGTGAVATKYNVLASLVNLSVSYATYIEGRAAARWSGTGVLLADAALTALGLCVLAAVVAITRRLPRREPAPAGPASSAPPG
ncbi:MAG: MFS transporter [Myxococcales bacterium]|nr:MFS transporter [Myxococcales bacterium]